MPNQSAESRSVPPKLRKKKKHFVRSNYILTIQTYNLLFGYKKFVNLNGKFCVKSVQISTAKFVSNDLSNLSNNSGVIAVLANLILFAFPEKLFAKNSK